jgi:tRNA(Ile)-lysidine synthase
MAERRHEGDEVMQAVGAAFKGLRRVVLAVSGGLDSMVLLEAVASLPRKAAPEVLVASFDHGTGAAARHAVETVRTRSRRLGLAFTAGVAAKSAMTEHQWRMLRWAFLRERSADFDAPIATAHTLDDQIETVFIRILREAGPRGLAALFAESEVIRPFLAVRRDAIVRYAKSRRITHVEDPSNVSRSHLRNRVRHDLLPAISRVRLGFSEQLLSIARRSAAWRSQMSDIADEIEVSREPDGSLRIARGAMGQYDAESLRALWPSIAAKANVVMDRRGTHRLAEFTMKGVTGGSIQLSGGVEVRMFRDHLLIRRWDWRRVEASRATRFDAALPRRPGRTERA